jgi:hypothetical protein
VAQEDLQDADVGAPLQQMGGKAVAQGVHGDLLGQTRLPDDLPQHLAHYRRADGALGVMSREEILSLRPGFPVVLAQQVQEALCQHDVAILLSFPGADMDAHPLAVNIDDAQSADFGDPETGRISRGDDGFVLHRADGRKELENFCRAENDRQGRGPLGMGKTCHHFGPFEGDVVQELEGVDVHIQRCRGGLTVPDQMEKEIAHLLLPHFLRGPHIMLGEMAGAAQVIPLRVRAVRLEEQILLHLIV